MNNIICFRISAWRRLMRLHCGVDVNNLLGVKPFGPAIEFPDDSAVAPPFDLSSSDARFDEQEHEKQGQEQNHTRDCPQGQFGIIFGRSQNLLEWLGFTQEGFEDVDAHALGLLSCSAVHVLFHAGAALRADVEEIAALHWVGLDQFQALHFRCPLLRQIQDICFTADRIAADKAVMGNPKRVLNILDSIAVMGAVLHVGPTLVVSDVSILIVNPLHPGNPVLVIAILIVAILVVGTRMLIETILVHATVLIVSHSVIIRHRSVVTITCHARILIEAILVVCTTVLIVSRSVIIRHRSVVTITCHARILIEAILVVCTTVLIWISGLIICLLDLRENIVCFF